MTKTVFPNRMVAHVWAQQVQDSGRSGNGQFYFTGPTIYSYGSHFPIARFTTDKDGNPCVLFTTRTYGITTGRHISYARHAIQNGMRIYHVDRVQDQYSDGLSVSTHEANVVAMAEALDDRATAAANPRKNGYWSQDARIHAIETDHAKVLDYCQAFGVTIPEMGLQDKRDAINAAFAKHNNPKRLAKLAKAKARRELVALMEMQPVISRALAYVEGCGPMLEYQAAKGLPMDIRSQYSEAVNADPEVIRQRAVNAARYGGRTNNITPDEWRDGVAGYLPYGPERTLLRRKGERLETSLGAECPWQHALVAFYKAFRCWRDGVTWKRNGDTIQVGHFQVDRIDPDGTLHAGCHRLEFSEMMLLARREGVELPSLGALVAA